MTGWKNLNPLKSFYSYTYRFCVETLYRLGYREFNSERGYVLVSLDKYYAFFLD